MKKILSWILIFTLCLGLFAGCGSEDENPTTQPTVSDTQPPVISTEDLQSAMEYIRTIYRGAPEKTPQDFQRIGNVPINGVDYEVVWSVNVDEDVIKIVKETNGMVTIDVNELCENDTPYELTATITDGNGNTVTHTWKHLLPAAMDMGEILEEAYALANGESLPYDATLTGKVISIDTAWNPDYQNITVTIAVEGHEDKPVQCYRLKGEGADKLAVGNIITVTGKLKNYNGTIEFDAGCILDKVEKGDAVEAPTDMIQIVKDAYKLADGKSLPYNATLKGKVIKVDTPYDPAYKNISVTIAVAGIEDKPILCYRLKGTEAAQIAVNDTITVTGLIKNYKGTIEFDAGCQMIERISGGGVAQAPSSDANKILSDAAKLGEGESLAYKATLSGEVISVDTPYSDQYGNVTVTMKVNGVKIQCYRMKGEHAADVRATDKITVSGFIKNYFGKLEFDTGCTLDAWTMGSRVVAVEYGPLKENTPYTLAMAQNGIAKNLYFNGKASGNYLATSEKAADAVSVYMEKIEGKGVRFFFNDGDVKTYINIIPRDTDASKTYPNLSTTASGYFVYDTEAKTYVVENAGSRFYLGTYGTYDTISTSSTYYITGGNASTVGVSQFVAQFIAAGTELPEQGETPDQPGDEDEDGTVLTIPEAITLGQAQASGTYTSVKYKVTGKITEIYNTQYGNMYIADEAGNTLLIYGTYSADGSTRFDAMETKPAVGDTVTIYGGVGNFNGTAQIKNGWIVAINGEGGEGGETPDTPVDPTTPVAPEVGTAYNFGMIQEAVSTTDIYYLSGGMTGFYMQSSKNVSDALEVYLEPATNGYYLYYMDGNTKTYINMVVSEDGAHVNGEYSATKSTVYTYNAEMGTLVTDINNGTYRFGTRDDKTYTTIGPVDVAKGNFYCKFYPVAGSEDPDEPDTPVVPPVDPEDNVLTVKEAIDMGAAKEHDTYTTEKYQVTGVITEVYNTTYGNMKITDGNGNILTIYGTYSADGSARYDAMEVKPVAGDTVTILGIVGQYNNVAQIKNGWIIEHTPAGGETPDEPDTPVVPPVDPEEPTEDYVTEVTAGTAYKWGINQEGLGKVIYFAGEMDGYYGKTTENFDEAVDVILEATTGGYYVSFVNASGAKKYVNVVISGNYKNFTIADSASTVYTFDEEYDTLNTVLSDGGTYYIGTYGTYKTFSVSAISKISTSYPSHFYLEGSEGGETPDEPDTPVVPPVNPEDNVLTVKEAIDMGAAKEHDTYTTEKYQVTGVITEVYNTTYGNMKITDGNGNILTIYGTYSADGSARYDAMEVKPVAGDTVTILGVVGQYNSTPQIKNGWIIEHTPAGGETPDEPETPDTPDTPVTPPTGTGYVKITDASQFVTGQYVIVAGNGYAPTAMDGTWLLSGQPTVTDGVISAANAEGYVMTLTVDGTSVKLVDANGNSLAPKAGNNNGILIADYDWAWTFENGKFKFAGTGSDTTMLACNAGSQGGNKFRSYKTTTVTGSYAHEYFAEFELYLYTEAEEEPAAEGFVQITEASQLTSGQYVMVAGNGYAPTAMDGTWLLSGQPTVTDGVITEADAEGYVFTLTVDGASVKLVDANGNSLAPKAGNNNGILIADYDWAWTFENGTFKFAGTGSDTTMLACNAGSQGGNKFRSYKTTTVTGSYAHEYFATFTLYKLAD